MSLFVTHDNYGHNLFYLIYLTILLYEKNLKMLPKTNIVLPFNRKYFRDAIQ